MSIRIAGRFSVAFALVLLAGCARDPVVELAAKLKDSHVEVRRAAAADLEAVPNSDKRVIGALSTALADEDTEVRYRSANAFGKVGAAAKGSVPALKTALQDPERSVRLRAAFAMSRIDPQEHSFMPVLVGAMREGDGRTLLEIASEGKNAAWAVPTLIGLLSHESSKVRTLAARALGSIGPAAGAAKGAIEAATHDSNAMVHSAAKDALKRVQMPAPTNRM
jgi:HEAT repeat protein